MLASWSPLSKIQVGLAGIATYPPGATFGPRRLGDFEFVWIIDGEAITHYDETVISAGPGTILLARPGMMDRYDWGPVRGATHAYFHFDFQRPAHGWPALERWPLALHPEAGDILRPLFRYLLGTQRIAEPERSSLIGACVELMLRAFVSGQIQTASEPPLNLPAPVKKALQMIGEVAFEDPPRQLTLTMLAQTAAVSPEHLCRLFARQINLGPLECLRLARLERAATLLSRSNLAAKEIAAITGFANPYHFSNAFKKVYQLSPSQYRGKIRAGIVPARNPIVRVLQTAIPPSGQ